MFFAKKGKVKSYLTAKQVHSAFDDILQDWLDKQLKEKLSAMGLTRIEIYVDWLDDYKCVGIQARKGKYFVECQIHPDDFSVAYDEDEADDDTEYRLINVEYFYNTVERIVIAL